MRVIAVFRRYPQLLKVTPRSGGQFKIMWQHALHYLGIRAINGVLGLATIYLLTRILSAEQYGLYALGLAAVNSIASILFQWLNAGVARLSSTYSSSFPVFLKEVNYIFKYLSLIGIIIIITWLILRPDNSITREMTITVGLAALAMGAYNMHLQIHNARLQPLRYGILSASRAAFGLTFAVIASLAGYGAIGALVGLTAGCSIAVYFFGYKFEPIGDAKTSKPQMRSDIIKYGSPLAITYAATMVIDVSDRFIIGWWYGPAAVGGYAASYDLAQQTIGVLLSVFYLAAFPKITKAWETNVSESTREPLDALGNALLLVAGAAAGIFISLSADIAHFMFGPSLRQDAILVMPWIASAIAIGCLKGYFFDIALHLTRRTSTHLMITLAMAAVNLMLNLILLPQLGILGASIAAVTAFTMGSIISYRVARGIRIIKPIGADIIKIGLSIAVMTICLNFINRTWFEADYGALKLIFKIMIGMIIFSLMCFLTNAADFRKLMSQRFRQIGQ